MDCSFHTFPLALSYPRPGHATQHSRETWSALVPKQAGPAELLDLSRRGQESVHELCQSAVASSICANGVRASGFNTYLAN